MNKFKQERKTISQEKETKVDVKVDDKVKKEQADTEEAKEALQAMKEMAGEKHYCWRLYDFS